MVRQTTSHNVITQPIYRLAVLLNTMPYSLVLIVYKKILKIENQMGVALISFMNVHPFSQKQILANKTSVIPL